MITIRKSDDRGHFNHSWLDTYHTFSFDRYYDPDHMGFRSLRVINEDRVAPGQGFAMHAHNDMEIITVILEGALEHKDSMGTGSVIRPGEVQRMTAGTGITHSEFNASRSESVHLMQIWILPNARGLTPSYEQKNFPIEQRNGRLFLIASPNANDGAVTINQDASLYTARLRPGKTVTHKLAPNRHAWVQVASGSVTVNGQPLSQGDGAAISGEEQLSITGGEQSDILLFDLA
ncbi:MAG: pirin family protein [candidate division Zixibacteria bacterium]|nr:pirin family protein [candidate division Zixibacteria bacterium]